MSTLHCELENGADLYVNEHQKIQHYRARSTEERRRKEKKNAKSRFFYFAGCVRKLRYYSDDSIGNQPQNRMEVFKMRDSVPSARYSAFVMYCVYGASRSSLLIYGAPFVSTFFLAVI